MNSGEESILLFDPDVVVVVRIFWRGSLLIFCVAGGIIVVVVAAVVEAFVFQDKGDGRRLANGRAFGSAGGLC